MQHASHSLDYLSFHVHLFGLIFIRLLYWCHSVYVRVCVLLQGGIMFPDTAKLYMAPIADSQCYDERFHFYISHNSMTSIDTSYTAG